MGAQGTQWWVGEAPGPHPSSPASSPYPCLALPPSSVPVPPGRPGCILWQGAYSGGSPARLSLSPLCLQLAFSGVVGIVSWKRPFTIVVGARVQYPLGGRCPAPERMPTVPSGREVAFQLVPGRHRNVYGGVGGGLHLWQRGMDAGLSPELAPSFPRSLSSPCFRCSVSCSAWLALFSHVRMLNWPGTSDSAPW